MIDGARSGLVIWSVSTLSLQELETYSGGRFGWQGLKQSLAVYSPAGTLRAAQLALLLRVYDFILITVRPTAHLRPLTR